MSSQRKAPPVYKPATAAPGHKPSANGLAMQPKPANSFRMETRPAPPVYRPQQPTVSSQPKMQGPSMQPQSQYELSPAVWIGNGRQQIRVKAKGSPTPIGSVNVHFNEPGKAFISDLQVAQSHRQHGLGSMLMKAALDSARRHGSTAMELEANPGAGSISKQALVSMYTKLGFRNSGFTRRGNPKMATGQGVQTKMAPDFRIETHAAPPVYRPQHAQNHGMQLKSTESFKIAKMSVWPSLMRQASTVQRAQALPEELEPEEKLLDLKEEVEGSQRLNKIMTSLLQMIGMENNQINSYMDPNVGLKEKDFMSGAQELKNETGLEQAFRARASQVKKYLINNLESLGAPKGKEEYEAKDLYPVFGKNLADQVTEDINSFIKYADDPGFQPGKSLVNILRFVKIARRKPVVQQVYKQPRNNFASYTSFNKKK